jgi:hypothetical protein
MVGPHPFVFRISPSATTAHTSAKEVLKTGSLPSRRRLFVHRGLIAEEEIPSAVISRLSRCFNMEFPTFL